MPFAPSREEAPVTQPDEAVPEPTGDDVPDGTQIPTHDDLPEEEGDAGVGDVELDPSVFEVGGD
jgi:hypothetical protein